MSITGLDLETFRRYKIIETEIKFLLDKHETLINESNEIYSRIEALFVEKAELEDLILNTDIEGD